MSLLTIRCFVWLNLLLYSHITMKCPLQRPKHSSNMLFMWQHRRHLRQMSLISSVINSGFNIYPMKSGFLGPSVSDKSFFVHWQHYRTLCGTVRSLYALLGCSSFLAMVDALKSIPHSNARPQKYNKICVMLSQHASVHHTGTNVFTEVMNVWIWHSEDRASWYVLIIKANEMHYFSNLFW